MQKIVALCGGVGGAKLADGLQQCLPAGALQLIVNTGDDFEHRGLLVCPDLDTVLYTLAGVANVNQGWGRENETWHVQSQWRELGIDTWFQLGDRDIALHLFRRELQAGGMSLTQISRTLTQKFAVPSELLPMCDAPMPTIVLTDVGEMPFQEYFVKLRCQPEVRGFRYGTGAVPDPTAEVRDALTDTGLDGIILCPSNPYLSIAPILAVQGMRDLLADARAPVIAVSPIIAGAAVKGPAAKIMRELDLPVSPLEIAHQYRDFLDMMLIDETDGQLLGGRNPADPAIATAPILMRTADDRRTLAAACLDLLRRLRA
jgi:LPPG:FO 2-phospho-L-lactate transferase